MGTLDTVPAQQATRAEKLADKSLGTLVKALFETYAVPEGYERELLTESNTPTDRDRDEHEVVLLRPPHGARIAGNQEDWLPASRRFEVRLRELRLASVGIPERRDP